VSVPPHPPPHVHGVAPEVVEKATTPDHTRHHRPGADPDPESQVPSAAVRKTVLPPFAHLERERRECLRVVRPLPGNARRDHVAVADRLDLLDLVAVDELLEAREEEI